MSWIDWFNFSKEREAPPSPPEKEDVTPAVPPNSIIILEEITHAEIKGYPESVFVNHERVYMSEEGHKCKITVTKNPQASGCGHNLKSPDDVGFISYISKLPVCKICEQEYYRLRDQTRHESCVCRHLVAPHELTHLEGKGFVCEQCKKKEKSITLKKVVKWLWGNALKPLITKDSQA